MSSWKDLFTRNFNNPQIVALILILLVISLVLYFFGGILAPVFLAIGLAYIINFPVRWLMRKGIKRIYALLLVFGILICILTWLFVQVGPLLVRQLNNLISEGPNIIAVFKEKLLSLERYNLPYFDRATLYSIYENISQYVQSNLDIRIDNILSFAQNVAYIALNLFLVPFMAFLMLVDYGPLKQNLTRFLPQSSELADGVFKEFMGQLDNYVRGKVIEFIIMTVLSFIAFAFFGLKYNLILSAIIGISVIIPYLGIIIATVPFVIVCFFQFDLSTTFWTLMVIHGVLQIFNGNILVPILYSKTNNIRPITVIVAVIFFGQIWGVLGVFLAIPLCTLIKAVANAWYLNSQLYAELLQRERESQQAGNMGQQYATKTTSRRNRKKRLSEEEAKADSAAQAATHTEQAASEAVKQAYSTQAVNQTKESYNQLAQELTSEQSNQPEPNSPTSSPKYK